ncbi:hypothetical protein WN48_08635 [Eufriesea mexicana]|nr:hypothetical protein WN48_08635 [Eufriesea mexicana]
MDVRGRPNAPESSGACEKVPAVFPAIFPGQLAEEGNESVIPEGWPLTLGRRGLVLQLGELEASALRLGECYLCIRSAAAVATTSGSGEAAAGETVERNTVEIAVVWRTTSMRAPGFLGWDREEEFMDWREVSRKGQGSTGAAGNSLAGPQSSNEGRDIDAEVDAGHAVMKSRSTSSVGTWKAELDESNGTSTRPSSNHSSSLSSDECRAKVKRCAKVVSSMTMEKWKETTRCETRSKALAPDDLKTPLRLDEAVLEQKQEGSLANDLENRLQSLRNLDDVGDDELPAFIGNLLVSVERKIERVSLDDLTFPCPACRNIDTDDPLLGCRCAGEDCGCVAGEDVCDCSSSAKTRKEQSTRSFEIAGIKHIDSDDEEEVRMGFVTSADTSSNLTDISVNDAVGHYPACFPFEVTEILCDWLLAEVVVSQMETGNDPPEWDSYLPGTQRVTPSSLNTQTTYPLSVKISQTLVKHQLNLAQQRRITFANKSKDATLASTRAKMADPEPNLFLPNLRSSRRGQEKRNKKGEKEDAEKEAHNPELTQPFNRPLFNWPIVVGSRHTKLRAGTPFTANNGHT